MTSIIKAMKYALEQGDAKAIALILGVFGRVRVVDITLEEAEQIAKLLRDWQHVGSPE